MQSKASTVKEYLANLEPERRRAIEAIRKVVKANLDPKIKEAMSYGMIGYVIPHSVYPDGYHCDPKLPLPFASIASQKNHIGLYLFCLYTSPDDVAEFQAAWKAEGKRLDMGKSCVRVKKLEDVPLEVLGRTIKSMTAKKFIASYESQLAGTSAGKKAAAKKAKVPKKKTAAKKTATTKSGTSTTRKKKPAAKKAATRKPAARKKAPRRA